jgi:guanylate kinase
MRGRLVILSGPSGVGKDTVIGAWAESDPRVTRVVAYTTRAPRTGEVDGVDYNFVTVSDFKARADRGEFLEWKEVHGNFYATPLKDMELLLSQGKVAVLKIDVQGGLEAMTKRPDALSIFLVAPSFEELEHRIRSRATDDEPTIQKRLANAREEIEIGKRYSHTVVNDDLKRAVEEIRVIVG